MHTVKKTRFANPRGIHVNLKEARGRSPSSQRWLRRQLNDPFVRRAQIEGYRSRAAYKLIELDKKFDLFTWGQNVLDIGCAPGGWLQVVKMRTQSRKNAGVLVGIDLLETEPVVGAVIFQGDAREPCHQRAIWQACQGVVDVVLSDMAAPTSGHAKTDQVSVAMLAETAWEIAEEILAQDGHFVCKVFAGGAEQELLETLKANFKRVKHSKPSSSRKESREMYLVACQRKTTPKLSIDG